MQNKDRIALFDFCETLVDFQTADAFVYFVRQRYPQLIKKGFLYYSQLVLEKTKLSAILFKLGININKKLLLEQLRGIDERVIDDCALDYYETRIKPHLIEPTIQVLKDLQNKGYCTYIVSGGYNVYLKHFAKEYRIDGVVCSTIKFANNLCLGKLDGTDCMGRHKIDYLSSIPSLRNLRIKDSISYSDSISDLPLLQYTKIGVVVSKNASQGWANKYNLKEIIWQKRTVI